MHFELLKIKEEAENEGARPMPSYDFRCQTARLLIQYSEFKKAARLLNMLIEENDERADIWHMLSLCLLQIK